MTKSIRVAVIDSDRIFREFLSDFLASETDIICAACRSSLASFRMPAPPDVFLVHCCTPQLHELRPLVDCCEASKFIAIRVDVEQLDLVACVMTGIDGFVPADADRSDYLSAIRCAGRGEEFVPRCIATALLRQMRYGVSPKLALPRIGLSELTPRERQIAELIIDGLSNKEIGRRLTIESSTVKTHVHNILRKLRLSRRTALVRYRALDPRGDYIRQLTPIGEEPG